MVRPSLTSDTATIELAIAFRSLAGSSTVRAGESR
jgi:hypothetical protein